MLAIPVVQLVFCLYFADLNELPHRLRPYTIISRDTPDSLHSYRKYAGISRQSWAIVMEQRSSSAAPGVNCSDALHRSLMLAAHRARVSENEVQWRRQPILENRFSPSKVFDICPASDNARITKSTAKSLAKLGVVMGSRTGNVGHHRRMLNDPAIVVGIAHKQRQLTSAQP